MFHIGDEVFFLSANPYEFGVYNGRIVEGPLGSDGFKYYVLEDVEDVSMPEHNCYGQYKALTEKCFKTAEELYVYIKEQHDIEVQKYYDEIKTVEDLLKFPLKYSFNAEEYTNYDAMEAYKIKAKELLNVNIEL